MVRDLRSILDQAAGAPPDLPDIEMIRRRARPVLRRRRAVGGLAAVGLTLASIIGVAQLREVLPERGPDVVQPAPAPVPSPALALRPGQIEPGTYGGEVGPYDVRLTLATDDWTLINDRDTWLAFTYRQYAVHLQVWGSVVPDDAPNSRSVEDTPADIVAWLTSNARLTATASRPDTVGGQPASEVVVRVARPLSRPPSECTTSRCVALARIAGVGELVHVEAGERARVLVLGDPGEQVVVTYRASEDEFDVLDQAARDLLSGLTLTPSD